ncbi:MULTISPECIES: DUF11 domain-containing protein [unclassified Coleofasciculus]|uniref:DUF11 domain-containing protein n=1 Tax=unclassified Coleofasciculus TaxID=2692782 RepID=UPI00188163F6|nr:MULTISPECIES: DUF11 domain-containing protein [unclassified Coleofasciculus]MBE9127747.1 DUF11 domain-containing protein [Coleofasciculus sp. LEGE 07081]MBE9150715.1 DUF11 domain-containing protein [Coleofasciculus sp. LEGE 07092]
MTNFQTQRFSWLTGSIAVFLCACSFWTQPARGEGSRELTDNQGFRPFLDYRQDSLDTGAIQRRTVIQVYTEAGETLYLGSSAVGVGQGTINYTKPNGASGTCGITGRIESRQEEVKGPNPISPGGDGYDPCTVTVDQTGVWQINFVSPNPSSTANPNSILAMADWLEQKPNDNYVTAWDVTVAEGGQAIPGRAFANYLALNVGSFAAPIRSETYILTEEGYRYQIRLNILKPFGFIFFSNNKGFRRPSGEPFFSSVPLDPPPNFQNPIESNSGDDRTHEIFFNPPVPGILNTPIEPIPPGDVNNFSFTGNDSTPGQAASPGGGTFRFTASRGGSYRIIIDLNSDGIYGNGIDRVLTGTAEQGQNTILWDGLDQNGNPLPGGRTGYSVSINLFAGQVHFPFLDVESNPDGIILQRLNGQGSPDFTVYYDDSRFSGPGIPPDPLDASINGVNSADGAHAYGCSNPTSEQTCFGDFRGIDTWAFLPSRDFVFSNALLIAEADLAIEKRVSSEPVVAGNPITYTIAVTNNGSNDVMGAAVTDTVPEALTDVNWTCAIAEGTGSCGAASGTGNAINTTVTLNENATALYTVTGTLSPNASGTLTNTATIPLQPGNRVGNDVTDPNPDNNTSTIQTPIQAPTADLGLTKTADPASPSPGENVTFTVTVTHEDGSLAATDVVVSDQLPAGLNFVSATASQGTYNNQTGIWNVGNIERSSSATLQIVATLNTSEPVVNRAQVSASDQPDPDSTPGNSIAGEDDQDSVTVPLRLTDLSLTKTASSTTVNVREDITYTLTLTNEDANAATDIAVTEPLPPEVTFKSVIPSQGSYNSSTGIWSVGNLPRGGSATLQIVATGNTPGSSINTAVISALDQSDPNPDNDRASEEVFLEGEPRLRLVKRITNVARNGMSLPGINFDRFVDDPNDPDDNASGWSQLPSGAPLGVPRIHSDTLLQSDDEVEYTIYFLSSGGTAVNGVNLCDLVPEETRFIADSFGPSSGILLTQGGTRLPQSNAQDTDSGTFFTPLTPVTSPCSESKNSKGAVFLQLGDIPSTAPNNVGFIRFRVKID